MSLLANVESTRLSMPPRIFTPLPPSKKERLAKLIEEEHLIWCADQCRKEGERRIREVRNAQRAAAMTREVLRQENLWEVHRARLKRKRDEHESELKTTNKRVIVTGWIRKPPTRDVKGTWLAAARRLVVVPIIALWAWFELPVDV